jgi:hypothetical protein
LVVYLPWGLGWLFYQGAAINELLDWGGILFTGAIAFLLPLYLAVRVLKQDDTEIGSLNVYGGFVTSRKWELYATVALLVVASTSVVLAIVGQALYDAKES